MRCLILLLAFLLAPSLAPAEEAFLDTQLIFPLEHWHNHSSSIVEMPNGGLFVTWFHGSGERREDDVRILGARLGPGEKSWSKPFDLADQPNFPDTNCTLFIDGGDRLWLFWPTILANEWHTALLNYKISSDYQGDGPPVWKKTGNILFKHDLERFEKKVRDYVEPDLETEPEGRRRERMQRLVERAGDKYFSRLGWMTRTHPIQLPSGRIIVPLYSDGYSFSLMGISDDGGETWKPSEPIVGYGPIQPSVVRKKDGTLVAYMRDAGPAPKRIPTSTSSDDGMTWSRVADTEFMNPGSSCEAIVLQDGTWLLVYNDTEKGRHSLAISLSDDEGKSWKWTRHIERDMRGEGATTFHYPSVMQARDGAIHLTYSYFLMHLPKDAARKSIKYVRFNAEWVKQGD